MLRLVFYSSMSMLRRQRKIPRETLQNEIDQLKLTVGAQTKQVQKLQQENYQLQKSAALLTVEVDRCKNLNLIVGV